MKKKKIENAKLFKWKQDCTNNIRIWNDEIQMDIQGSHDDYMTEHEKQWADKIVKTLNSQTLNG